MAQFKEIWANILIEIIGWSMRVPGASNPDEFWALLRDRRCAISEIPENRWSHFRYWHPRFAEPGKSYSFAAGVLDDVWGFDPAVFGISPREAEQMDPQQRLLLQVTWEAIENAGVSPSDLAGENVGVYVGASALDYANEGLFDPSVTTGHFMTGNTLSIISNRLSHIFDLRGPSLTIDTACSSSLVALHEACHALNSGRIDTAIVAGVNVLASPFPFVGFAQATMLSPDGVCRAFDERGAGYVRSEGCLSFVLRRKDARRWKGQAPVADIVGVDVNSDGRTVGMSLPSAEQQAALLERIYDNNGIDPASLAFVEAHGTGTRVGDPAEAISIGEVLGKARSSELPIGSVKTNIGHLEPASGLAGLAKAVLALQYDYLPASLHFEKPNPDIDFAGLNLKVAAEGLPIGKSDRTRYAGVNSFGFGGTNVHVIIKDAEAETASNSAPRTGEEHSESKAELLVLSAQSRPALKDMAARYAKALASKKTERLSDVRAAAWYRKKHFDEKLIVRGSTRSVVISELKAFAEGDKTGHSINASQGPIEGTCAFVFSGNGAQWAGMGQSAYRYNAAFKAVFDDVAELFVKCSDISLVDLLFDENLSEKLQSAAVAQPLLFSVQVGICKALATHGVHPDVVLGHSIGEAAAAAVSGAMTLPDAVRLVHHRSSKQEIVAGAGTMAALVLSEAEARRTVTESGFSEIEIAAINSPKSVSLSGKEEDIVLFGKYARSQHIAFRKVDLDYPFHSSLIDPVEGPFREALGEIPGRNCDIRMISTVTGSLISGEELGLDYWWRNLRQPVRFASGIAAALDLGVRHFIEIGPKPILQSYIRQTAAFQDRMVSVSASLTAEQRDDHDPVLDILTQVIKNGIQFDERAVFGENPDHPIQLPTYPWQTREFRFENTFEATVGLFRGDAHPLLGWRVNADSTIWHTHLDPHVVRFLADHVIDGAIIYPGAAFVETALAVGKEVYGEEQIEVRNLDIVRALALSSDSLVEVQTRFFPDTATVEISSRKRLSGDDWALNAKARLFKAVDDGTSCLAARHVPTEVAVAGEDIYRLAQSFGLQYGPAFQRACLISKVEKGAYRVQLNGSDCPDTETRFYGIHPADLDACFHGLLPLFSEIGDTQVDPGAYVPVGFDSVQQLYSDFTPAFAEIRVRRFSQYSVLADFRIFDGEERPIMLIEGARFRAVKLAARHDPGESIYRIESTPVDPLIADLSNKVPDLECPEDVARRVEQIDGGPDLGPEENESHLLLEAAAQRTACDVLKGLRRKDQKIHQNDLPETSRPYFLCLIDHMVRMGAIEEVSSGVFEFSDEQDELPEFDTLLAAVIEESPQEVAAAALLATSRRVALGIVAGKHVENAQSGAMLDHFKFSSPGARSRQNFLKFWLDPFLQNWDRRRPLHVLDLGGSGFELASFIQAKLPDGAAKIVIADPDAASAARLATSPITGVNIEVSDTSKGWGDLLDRRFDLVVSSGRLHEFQDDVTPLSDLTRLLAPNGQVVAVEPEHDLLSDAIFGFQEYWFEKFSRDSTPMSRTRSAGEWASYLEKSAFAKPRFRQLTVDGHVGGAILTKASGIVDAQPEPVRVGETHGAAWIILCADNSAELTCAKALSFRLAELGIQNELLVSDGLSFDPSDVTFWQETLGRISVGEADERVVIHLPAAGSNGDSSALERITNRSMSAVAIARACGETSTKFAFVSPLGSGMAHDFASGSAEQSAMWAFARVFANEMPDVDVHNIDLSITGDSAILADQIIAAVQNTSRERELCQVSATTRAARVLPGYSKRGWSKADAVRLGFSKPGSLSNLSWTVAARKEPGPEEVEIEVVATGLNFRDVMWSLGMLPDEALEDGYGGPTLGLECSGRVARVGSAIKHLRPGDPVVAFTGSGFSSYVTVPGFAVAKVSDEQDLVGAATIPVAFLTAYYALVHLAQLREGQWLLLHGGAGGVGLAALQIAKWKGAKVIATAGTDEKRSLLSALGADYVLNSRSLEFATQVMSITGGEGVHAVLNSLAGEAMERSIQAVRPFGCFLELGKRDYYANTKIGLRPFRKNLSYFGIDVDQLLLNEAGLAHKLIGEIFSALNEGIFVQLPFRVFEGANVQDAFRLMQRSGHIGKILVKPESPDAILVPPQVDGLSFDQEGAHIVVGGLGGFGGEVAYWLADHGAKRITLTSRTGIPGDTHRQIIRTLADKGVEVRPHKCDITDKSQVQQLLGSLRSEMPIKGIIHAAMVLDDGMLASLDADRFKKVLAPKVSGATHLDELTEQDDLDYFILFSSATTMVGNPGQAHYVAANGYLEGLARERRYRGRPALAVGWGPIGDVGFLARNSEVSAKLSKHLGSTMMRAREGLDLVAKAIETDDGSLGNAVLYVGRFDWQAATQMLPVLKQPYFENIVSGLGDKPGEETAINIAELIAGKGDKEAKNIIAGLLAREIADILRLPVEDIGVQRPLADFGMDSLMGLELRTGIHRRFDIEIPLISINGGTCIDDFAAQILARIKRNQADELAGDDMVKDNLAGQHLHEDLTEEQKAALHKMIDDKLPAVGGLIQ